MAKTALVGIDLEEGRRFLEVLAQAGIPLSAALWQHEWLGELSLLVATSLVDEVGVRNTYRKFDEVLSKANPTPGVDLLNVSVYTPRAAFIKSLRKFFRGTREVPVHKQPIGDHVLDDGYIYFVK